MTDQEINETAAKKLGWTLEDHARSPLLNGNFARCRCISGKHWYRNGPGILPDYTGSIFAAWEIVDVLRGQGSRVSIDLFKFGEPVQVTIDQDFTVFADTAPMAICLAFLKLP